MFLRNRVIAIFLFCTVFWLSVPARAAIDQAGADHLTAVIADVLKAHNDRLAAQGGTLAQDGPLSVEPDETYYAATLPFLTVKEKDGDAAELGMIALNAIPGENKGQWKITMAIPTPLTFRGKDGKITGTVDIAKQNFSGIWDESIGGFAKVDASYNGFSLREDNVATKIARLRVTHNYTPASADKGNLTLEITADGITRTPPGPVNAALPTAVSFNAKIENLPVRAMAGVSNEADAKRAMAAAGTIITIEGLKAGNGVYSLTADGKLRARDGVPFGFLGKVSSRITNLEKVVEILKTPPPGKDARTPQATAILAVIAVLQMVGQQEKAQDGTITRHYSLETTDKGAVLINGIDLKTLFSFGKKTEK